MEEALNHFEEMLAAAVARIGRDYFQLPVAGADAVYRERVYCYELYHQLRSAWGDFPFSVGGEIDKAGHPFFRDGPYGRSKPDLLIHSPGDMLRNLACVEVKCATVSTEALRADLEKLAWFCNNARYFAGIQLIYGDAGGLDHVRRRLQEAARGLDVGALRFLYHARVRDPPEAV
jgi:hypothetical protein